jgi:signal transduction histidine kinase
MSAEKLAEIQSRGSGVGIRGMRERLRQYKGTLNIESGASGTTISVTIPLDREAITEEHKQAEPLQAGV